jgi:hypothetical protein
VDKKDYFQHTNGYDDFFPLDEMRRRLGPSSVITMREFLEREAYPGHLGPVPPLPMLPEDQAGKVTGARRAESGEWKESVSAVLEPVTLALPRT